MLEICLSMLEKCLSIFQNIFRCSKNVFYYFSKRKLVCGLICVKIILYRSDTSKLFGTYRWLDNQCPRTQSLRSLVASERGKHNRQFNRFKVRFGMCFVSIVFGYHCLCLCLLLSVFGYNCLCFYVLFVIDYVGLCFVVVFN